MTETQFALLWLIGLALYAANFVNSGLICARINALGALAPGSLDRPTISDFAGRRAFRAALAELKRTGTDDARLRRLLGRAKVLRAACIVWFAAASLVGLAVLAGWIPRQGGWTS